MDARTPRRVVPLVADAGATVGHRLVLLSLEVYAGWMDLRFARVDEDGVRPLPRRVPPDTAWQVEGRDGTYTVTDAVGRGDRGFSNGEVRIVPAVPDGGDRLRVRAVLLEGEAPLETTVEVPPTDASAP